MSIPNIPELWADVPGYSGIYEISNQGEVRSVDRVVTFKNGVKRAYPGSPKTKTLNDFGYYLVTLSRSGSKRTRFVHRMVLEAFVGPCPSGREACHNDGDPLNNNLSNLRWDTHAGNMQDVLSQGNNRNARKSHCTRGHRLERPNLVEAQIKRGRRNCKACARAHSHVYYHPEKKPHIAAVADRYYEMEPVPEELDEATDPELSGQVGVVIEDGRVAA